MSVYVHYILKHYIIFSYYDQHIYVWCIAHGGVWNISMGVYHAIAYFLCVLTYYTNNTYTYDTLFVGECEVTSTHRLIAHTFIFPTMTHYTGTFPGESNNYFLSPFTCFIHLLIIHLCCNKLNIRSSQQRYLSLLA